ncbi:MAG TPA: DNA topoisomerase [Candidatus Baltobacteraceae bacterium]|nr:DNA topoisomerase [Candidatus Baltobacteraceae bacterium]
MAHAQLTPTDLRVAAEDIRKMYRGAEENVVRVYDIVRRCSLRALSAKPLVVENVTSWKQGDWLVRTVGRKIIEFGWLEYDEFAREKYAESDSLAELDEVSVLATELSDDVGMPLADLLEAMALLQIGRPSTYASTIQRLVEKGYIDLSGSNVTLTGGGREMFEALRRSMPLVTDVSFTALVERSLDAIAAAESVNESRRLADTLLRDLWARLNSKDYYVAQIDAESFNYAPNVIDAERVAEYLIPRDHPLRLELSRFEALAVDRREMIDEIALNIAKRVSVYGVFALMHIGAALGARSAEELSELLEFDVRARWFVDYPLDRSAWPADLIRPVVEQIREHLGGG